MEKTTDTVDESTLFLIEEVDSKTIPQSELSQFKEAIQISDLIDDNNETDEEEPELIQKFVRGEGEFPSIFTKLEPEDEETEYDGSEKVHSTNIEIEEPTTSARAAKRQIKKATNKPAKGDYDDGISTERRKHIRNRSVLSVALQGLMGEANLSYARGQIEMAEKLCLEIIRQNPMASEPFLTLAEIYEMRDKEKHLEFLTIAAHLNPHDRDQWIRIAGMHIAKGNLSGARIFYSKAIKAIPKDYDLRWRKALLLEKMNDIAAAMWTFLRMIPLIPAEQSVMCLHTAKKVAAYYHENQKFNFALEAMEGAYKICSELFSMENLNLYMELLIVNKEYKKVVQCLRERTNLQVGIEPDCNVEQILYIHIPDEYLPDFRAKLCVSLIKLQLSHLLYYIIQNVQEHIPPVEAYLNLYVDVAEALMQENKYAEAIELLRPITDCHKLESCPAFIYLRCAECMRQLNRYDEAIEYYQNVVDSAPYCYDARLTLAALLKQQGRFEDAVKALEQVEGSEAQPLHARLLYERCMMLQHMNYIDAFLQAGCNFLGRKSVKLRNREELFTFTSGSQVYHLDGLKTILQMRNINHSHLAPDSYEFNIKTQNDITDLTVEDEYKLFLDLLEVGFKHKKFSVLERLCFLMVTTKRFVDFRDLAHIIILACYYNDDCIVAFCYLREMLTADPTNNSLWNMLSLFFQKAQDVRFYRYLRRAYARNSSLKQIRLFLGHYSLNGSSYKLALSTYVQLLKEQPTSLVALCIAVVFNQLSMQKRVVNRTAPVGQAIAFADKYAALRRLECIGGTCNDFEESITVEKQDLVEQEICYNLGRLYHQAGLTHLAVEYYERALKVKHPVITENEEYIGLKQETAYNLHLIYRASGNLNKAREVLFEYCVV